MTRARAVRWGMILLIGIGAGVLLGQVAAPTPAMGVGEHGPYPVVVTNQPVQPQDPWFVRYASLVNMLGTGLVIFVAFLAKAKVIDPLRAEFKAEAGAVRAELREEAAARNLALVTISATFEKSMAGVAGTVAGLGTGVTALGPAITGISAAAAEMARTASQISKDQAVAQERLAGVEQRLTKVEDVSVGMQREKTKRRR